MWFKVDDQLAFHRKSVSAGNAAMGLWVRAASWSMNNLTDGHVPDDIVVALNGKKEAQRLVDAGLWDRNGSGYYFHDWGEFQPTAEEVAKQRAATAERVRRWRKRQQGQEE